MNARIIRGYARLMLPRLRHLPAGLAASAVVLVVGVVAGALARGGSAAAGAAVGVLLVAASYSLSSLVIAWADRVEPRLVLPVGLFTYVIKFTVIGVVMYVVAGSGWSGLPAMGIALIAAVFAWMLAQSWWTWHARIPYVDPT